MIAQQAADAALASCAISALIDPLPSGLGIVTLEVVIAGSAGSTCRASLANELAFSELAMDISVEDFEDVRVEVRRFLAGGWGDFAQCTNLATTSL